MNDNLKKVTDSIKFMDKKTKVYLYGTMIIIIFIIIIAIASCALKTKKITYLQMEDKMAEAASEYFKDNVAQKPVAGSEVIIDMSALVEGEYIKPFTDLLEKGENCSGQVKVKNNNETLIYVPYLTCGTDYFSTELYKKVITSTVTSGDGLYKIGNEYIYRGQNVANFVSFANKIWRVVKVTNNQTMLILYESDKKLSYSYDDRFNTERKTNSGINDFEVSRLKESLNGYLTNEANFSESDLSKMVSMTLCTGNRTTTQLFSSGKVECNKTEVSMIGIMNIYDYAKASLDKTCQKPEDLQCQNYNYLAETNRSWWTSTGASDTTFRSYIIKTKGAIDDVLCSSKAGIRPIITIDSETFARGGTGTQADPYVVK